MFSNLALYYLNQMGIIPWIEKAKHDPLPCESKINAFLLLVTSKLKTKEEQLLTNIRSFLGLPDNDVVHLQLDEMQHVKGIRAAFILSFGCNIESASTRIEPLSFFLENPIAKKKLFRDLHVLKEQFTLL